MHTTIDRLGEGDCFLWVSPAARERELARLSRLNLWRRDLGKDPFDSVGVEEHLKLYAEPHIVYTVVLATRERVSQRVSDGRRFIWYESVQVDYVDRREEFEERLRTMAEERAKFDKLVSETQRKRPTSKKQVIKDAQLAAN